MQGQSQALATSLSLFRHHCPSLPRSDQNLFPDFVVKKAGPVASCSSCFCQSKSPRYCRGTLEGFRARWLWAPGTGATGRSHRGGKTRTEKSALSLVCHWPLLTIVCGRDVRSREAGTRLSPQECSQRHFSIAKVVNSGKFKKCRFHSQLHQNSEERMA